MSKENRDELDGRLMAALRRFQQGTDLIDQAACDLLGVNRTDGRCIDILDLNGRMSAGELAEAAALSPAAITTALDRLERAGYVRRMRDTEDRRRVMVEVTPLARELSWKIYGPMAETGAPALAALSDRDMRMLISFLEQGATVQWEQAAVLRERLAKDGPLNAAPEPRAPPPAGTSAD